MMQCFVTGGTGFLGSNLIKELCHRGHHVRALVRNTSNVDDLKQWGVELVPGEITDQKVLEQSLPGTEWLFHLAGKVTIWDKDPMDYYRVNVDGLKTVVDIASIMKIPKIICTSSFIALGPTDGQIADESFNAGERTFYNLYHQTKYLANLELKSYMSMHLPVIPVYPGIIYGPGKMTEGNILMKTMQDFIKRKLPGIPGNGNQKWNYVYVDDVVRGHILAAEKGKIATSYILGGDNVSMNDLMQILSEITGKRPPKLHIPFALAKVIAACENALATLINEAPQNTPGTIGIYQHDWAMSSAKAEKELGYTHIPFREGLQKSYDWLMQPAKTR